MSNRQRDVEDGQSNLETRVEAWQLAVLRRSMCTSETNSQQRRGVQ